MKCDELFVYCKTTCDPQGLYYSKPEVDEAIAELKVRNVMFHDEAKYYKAENESLKSKLESVQASAYADSVDAGMRERRLRRALWLARALRARDIQRWWLSATLAPITERACRVWNNIEIKCRKKAEECK
jgi:hypothetical protein